MLNQVVLSGNLGANPEVFYSSEGNAVASFNLAFRASKNKTGWIKIYSFNKLAEIVEKYLSIGAKVCVVGSLTQEKWTTEDGVKRSTFQVIANRVEFIKLTKEVEGDQSPEDDIPF